MSSSKCARCDKTVYPVEGLRCLDKIWHKGCFKCHECNMTLNMKNYKGFEKRPYCNAHCPQAKATTVADTPEIRRLAENTRIQSQAKYHEDFEKSKGKNFTPVADDPELRRIKETSKLISNVAYHGEVERKKQMEERRNLSGIEELPLVRSNSNNMMMGNNNSTIPSANNLSLNSHNSTNNSSSNISINNNNNVPKPNRNSQNLSGGVVQMKSVEPMQHMNQYQLTQQQYQQQQYQQQQQMQRQQQQQQLLQQQQQQQRQQQLLKQQQQQYLAQQQQQHNVIVARQSLQLDPQQQQQQQLLIQRQQQQMLMQQQQQKQSINMPIMASRQPPKQAVLAQTNHHPLQHPSYPNVINGRPSPHQQQMLASHHHMLANGQRISNSHMLASAPTSGTQLMPNHQQPLAQPNVMQPAGRPLSSGSLAQRRVFRAMYDYVANDVDEVSFYENDLLVDCVNVDRNWLIGKVARSGQSGMLPANYVTELPSR